MSSHGTDSPVYDGARAAGEWRGTPSSAGAGRWLPPGPQGLAPLHLPQHTALQIQQRRHALSLSAQNHTLHQLRRRRGGKVTEQGDVRGPLSENTSQKGGSDETINPASTSRADHWLCSQRARWVITGIIPPSRNPVINTLCIGRTQLLSSVNWRLCQAHLSSAAASGHRCEKQSLQLLSMSRRRQIFSPDSSDVLQTEIVRVPQALNSVMTGTTGLNSRLLTQGESESEEQPLLGMDREWLTSEPHSVTFLGKVVAYRAKEPWGEKQSVREWQNE